MIVLTLFCTLSEGQNLRRRRIQRQQKQFEEISNQQSSTSVSFLSVVLQKKKIISIKHYFSFC